MKRRRRLWQDALIVAASVALAVAIVRYDWVGQLLSGAGDKGLFTAFVAGIFFTSLVTTAPAIAVLGELGLSLSPFALAVVGGLGAVVGDYLIFAFVRDRVSEDVAYLLERNKTPRFFKLFKRRTFRRFLPFIGGLIIASPLPDELGLAMLGMTKMNTGRFALLSFSFNAIGIFLIALAARSLS